MADRVEDGRSAVPSDRGHGCCFWRFSLKKMTICTTLTAPIHLISLHSVGIQFILICSKFFSGATLISLLNLRDTEEQLGLKGPVAVHGRYGVPTRWVKSRDHVT